MLKLHVVYIIIQVSRPTKRGNNVENLLVWMFQKKLLKKEALLYEIETEAIFQEEFSYTSLP